MRLYDLSEQYNNLLELLEQDSDNEALKTMLDGVDDAFDTKAESIVKLMRSKAAERDAIDDEVNRLRERAKKIDKEVTWLETYIHNEMVRTGKEKVKSSLFSISLAKCPPSVNIVDEVQVPEIFFTVKEVRNLDKRGILERLKSGEVIPGVELQQRITLKIK
ncbi:MAG: hypothetical protein K0R47_5968 [Brevibacillus sp.]|jgi:predicted nuclease with TOPRIM domain|nr:hypothetical protein [Brevibacillus sp.]